jgi:hypothetical protein
LSGKEKRGRGAVGERGEHRVEGRGPTEDLVGGGLEEEAAVGHLATTPQYGGEFC